MSTDIFSSTLNTLAKVLEGATLPSATFVVEDDTLQLLAVANLNQAVTQDSLPQQIVVESELFQEKFLAMPQSLFGVDGDEKIFNVSSETENIPEVFDFASQLGFEKVSFLLVSSKARIHGLVLVGGYDGHTLNKKSVQPYTSLVQLANTILQQTAVDDQVEKTAKNSESLTAITSAIKTPWDTTAFFTALHEQIKLSIGDYAFIGALYDEKTDSIHIPYIYEEGTVQSIESFPLGEGLTTVLLRSKQPLLLVENTEEQAKALGAKVEGKPAKSWMGVPLIIEDQAIGAFIVQDLKKEKVFTQE